MEYKKLVGVYSEIESTSKRLEKTHIVAGFIKHVDIDELQKNILLLEGRIFPSFDEKKIGVASRVVIKALNKALGISADDIEKEWKNTGDLGLSAENLVKKKKQVALFSHPLTVTKVFNNLRKLPELEGHGAVERKVDLISELLTSASPEEARYIIRSVLEDLRVGVGEGVIRDAIVWAYFDKSINVNYDEKTKNINPENRELYNAYVEAVQTAYDVLNDFGEVAALAKASGLTGLKSVGIEVGRPLKVMLYQKARDITDAFERVGKPCAIEYKYDGFRMQLHKKAGKIKIFTRRLDEVTAQFPEVVEYAKEHIKADSYILDGEAVGYNKKTHKYMAFQSISQRIKRKYDIEKTADDFPVELNIFDVMSFEGKNTLNLPFKERRKIIEGSLVSAPRKIVLSRKIETSDEAEAEKFYMDSLAAGNEGVMFKNLEGVYKPGSRVGYGVKVKPVMESLDLVIVGAEWGEGKRSGWLTSFMLACYNPDTGEFLEIGKVGTGIKEKVEEGVSFEQLTELLKPHFKTEKGRDVVIKPSVVVEINFEEIQKSPTYSSGYALRFPRVVRIREDRAAEECSDSYLVEDLYGNQRSR